MIFLGYIRNGKRKKWLDFRRDPDPMLFPQTVGYA